MQEVEIVEVHGDDLVLGVVTLQFDGYHPLYRFLEQALHGRLCPLGIELLGQLLGDGGTTTSTFLT